MTRKIKIKIKDLDNHEFYLEEDAKRGDYFSLDDIGVFSIDYIKEEFSTKINKIANEKVQQTLLIDRKNWINEFKATDEEYLNLKSEALALKADLNSVTKLFEEKIKNLENQKESEFQLKFKNLSLEKEKQIMELNLRINELKNKNYNDEKEKEAIYQDKIKELTYEIEFHKKIIEKREIKNIKLIGEDFEKWISEEFDKYFSMNDRVILNKTTKSIKSDDKTIPDFEFLVLGENGEIFGSATIEAKTETNSGKTKNSSHYEKLNKEREKLNSEYAILVSELEPENTFLIKKVPEYKNMFVIRPAYLMTFLSLIQYISNEKQVVKKLELKFKDKQQISKEFDEMKNEILDNSLKHLNTQCLEIKKQNETIEKASRKIREAIEIVLETHINTIRNKIEKFRIESIKNKIEENS